MTVACRQPVHLLDRRTNCTAASREYFERYLSKIASNFLRVSARSESHTGASPALMNSNKTFPLGASTADFRYDDDDSIYYVTRHIYFPVLLLR